MMIDDENDVEFMINSNDDDDDGNDDGGQVKTGKSSLPVETCWNWSEPCSPDTEKNRDRSYHNS